MSGFLNNTFNTCDIRTLAANGTFGPAPAIVTQNSYPPYFGVGNSSLMQRIQADTFTRNANDQAERKKKNKILLTLAGIAVGIPLVLGAMRGGAARVSKFFSPKTSSGSSYVQHGTFDSLSIYGPKP